MEVASQSLGSGGGVSGTGEDVEVGDKAKDKEATIVKPMTTPAPDPIHCQAGRLCAYIPSKGVIMGMDPALD